MGLYERWEIDFGKSVDPALAKTVGCGEVNDFSALKYHSILCPEWPDFLDKYISLPMMQRLDGVGLLCGTDWTQLFDNKFPYSRLDHSIGVALIVWNFTHNKKQALAGLFHDVSTPAFSHVNDFRKGDALTQESTEFLNQRMIMENQELVDILRTDGIYGYEVRDYHVYPVADNDIPRLSADRLEYMYPSGASLNQVWSLEDVAENYASIKVMTNEDGIDELGFSDMEMAEEYTRKFLDISLILQHNEDKVAMQLLADTVARAMELGIIDEDDLYTRSEKFLVDLFEIKCKSFAISQDQACKKFCRLYKTFRGMKKVIHSPVAMDGAYSLSTKVKLRYIDPLVKLNDGSQALRVSKCSKKAADYIKNFLEFKDSEFGCVPWIL